MPDADLLKEMCIDDRGRQPDYSAPSPLIRRPGLLPCGMKASTRCPPAINDCLELKRWTEAIGLVAEADNPTPRPRSDLQSSLIPIGRRRVSAVPQGATSYAARRVICPKRGATS